MMDGDRLRAYPRPLAAQQQSGKIAMSVTERTHPASKILSIGRKELEYYEFGAEDSAAHPLLFHYGLPGSASMASLAHDVAKQLGVRVIAPNRPGCGRSTFDPNRKLNGVE